MVKVCSNCYRMVSGDTEKCPDCGGTEFLGFQWEKNENGVYLPKEKDDG